MLTSKELCAKSFDKAVADNELASRFINSAYEATRKAEGVREDLVKNIEWMVEDLQRALAALRQGRQVNSLGIIQGKGSEIDRQCGEFHVTIEIARQVQFQAQRAGLLPE